MWQAQVRIKKFVSCCGNCSYHFIDFLLAASVGRLWLFAFEIYPVLFRESVSFWMWNNLRSWRLWVPIFIYAATKRFCVWSIERNAMCSNGEARLHGARMALFPVRTESWDTLLWRHNGRDCVPNHQPHDCLLNRLFRQIKENLQAPRHWSFVWNLPVTDEFSAKWPVTRQNVSIWWRHNDVLHLFLRFVYC